jgi:hypothetical protein
VLPNEKEKRKEKRGEGGGGREREREKERKERKRKRKKEGGSIKDESAEHRVKSKQLKDAASNIDIIGRT